MIDDHILQISANPIGKNFRNRSGCANICSVVRGIRNFVSIILDLLLIFGEFVHTIFTVPNTCLNFNFISLRYGLDVWADHDFPIMLVLAIFGSLVSYIYSAPPLKLMVPFGRISPIQSI